MRRLLEPLDPSQMGLSFYLHFLRLHGKAARFPRRPSFPPVPVLDLLTDEALSRQYFQAPSILLTPHGARFCMTPAAPLASTRHLEAHRDQCLALLAELGVPLTQPLRFADREADLREVLRDSLANFHPHQHELEWTALCYALYLPPLRAWANRFGERATFDDLAGQLLGRRPEKSPCAGTHLVYALTVLARADEAVPVLSPEVRQQLRARLASAVRACLDAQAPDGSWSPDWHRALADGAPDRPPRRPSLADRLLATSHLAEWLLYLPDDLQVPGPVLLRAARWLHARFQDAPPDVIHQQYCPFSHAACFLLYLAAPDEG
jgi:hypothetical protein